jgi:hypothetical protein
MNLLGCGATFEAGARYAPGQCGRFDGYLGPSVLCQHIEHGKLGTLCVVACVCCIVMEGRDREEILGEYAQNQVPLGRWTRVTGLLPAGCWSR